MKNPRAITWACLSMGAIALLESSCLPAMVAAGAYAYNAPDQDKENFAKINIEREKDGLAPLTWGEFKNPAKATPMGSANTTSGNITASTTSQAITSK